MQIRKSKIDINDERERPKINENYEREQAYTKLIEQKLLN